MRTELFEKRISSDKKTSLKIISIISTIYFIIISPPSLLWIIYGFGAAKFALVIAFSIVYLIFLIVFFIVFNSYRKDRNEIKSIIQSNELEELYNILFFNQKRTIIVSWLKDFAFLILYENEPLEIMNQLCINIGENFNNDIYECQYIKYLKKYDSPEDKKLIYERLFDAILKLQRAYFTEYTTEYLGSQYGGTVLEIKGASTMDSLSHLFDFDTTELFVQANVITTFRIFFKELKAGEPVNLQRIAQLSRTSENVAERILLDLLEMYPELGKYQKFEMLFIPSNEIVNFEKIVDFDSYFNVKE